MAIRTIRRTQPDIYVTENELRRYKDEYMRFCGHYCGTPPSLEEYIRAQKNSQRTVLKEWFPVYETLNTAPESSDARRIPIQTA